MVLTKKKSIVTFLSYVHSMCILKMECVLFALEFVIETGRKI